MKSFKREVLRKAIHFLGVGYIPLYLLLGKNNLIIIIGVGLLLFCTLEFLRKVKSGIFPEFLLRDYEKTRVGAHIYFGISALLLTVFYPVSSCFVGIIAASIGDGVAGLLKRSEKYKGISTPAMTIASFFFLFGLNFGLKDQISLIPALFAFFLSSLIERKDKIFKIHVDDNLTVPIAAATFYFLFELIT